MKMKKNIKKLTLVASLLIVSFLSMVLAGNNLNKSDVSLLAQPNKNSFLLGEVVNLKFEFVNNGNDTAQILGNEGMGGNTQILITRKGERFRKYFRSDWGRTDGEANIVSLLPNQSYKLNSEDATILWNGKPNYSHLSLNAAKKADSRDERILTDYAFPEAGIYLVKVTSCLLDKLKGCSIPVESNVIEITFEEPTGEDLQVWNQIKGNREIALLMQRGAFSIDHDADKAKLVNEVEQIIEKYPNSTYSAYLKPSLDAFKAHDAKLEEFKAKIKAQAKP
jgi:hypothetical protein